MAENRKDHMGVAVVNHFVSPDAISCYGCQMPVKSITEIAMYEAGYDNNGSIVKGRQLFKIRMSDLQFGKLIAKPNASGHHATLEYLDGFSTFCTMEVVNSSGAIKLFDTVSSESDYVTFYLKVDSAKDVGEKLLEISQSQDEDALSRNTIYMRKEGARFRMSFDQYARFVRADKTEIPCTLVNVGKFKARDEVLSDQRDLVHGDVDSEGHNIFKDTLSLAKQAQTLLNNTGCKKAAERNEFIALCRKLFDAFEDTGAKTKNYSNAVAHNVIDQLEREVEQYVNEEMASLPSDVSTGLLSHFVTGRKGLK